jgi:hypothetical protein
LPIYEPWTPVDLVTGSIVAAAQQPMERKILNIMPPRAVALQDVGLWLRDAGFNLDAVSVKEWCERLAKSSHQQDRAILGFFQQRAAGPEEFTLPVIEDTRTRQFLQASDIELPDITQSHFNAYLRVAIHQRLISDPNSEKSHKRGLYEPA